MFEGWENYYLMVGSSAGALIGLMFVVVTLTAGRDRREVEGGKHLYTSPVVWHLGVVLVVSGGAIAPSLKAHLFGAGIAILAILGVAMGIRSAVGIARTRLSGHENFWFDICWYGIVPAIVYAALGGAAAGVIGERAWGASAVAAAVMALLLISIHAEWDLVTFLAPGAPAAGGQGRNNTKS
jgi:hypothetical protein